MQEQESNVNVGILFIWLVKQTIVFVIGAVERLKTQERNLKKCSVISVQKRINYA